MSDDREDSNQGVTPGRREFLAGIASISLAGRAAAPEDAASRNLIREENMKPGASDWQLTRVRPDKSAQRTPWIEGYCSKQSVKPGESIDIFISSDPPRDFLVEVFRTGYYGGKGARLMTTLGPFPGKTQKVPEPGPKDLHECRWEASTTLKVPGDWPSGVYLGRLSTIPKGGENAEPYWQSYVIFIVKDDRPADVLFQCSDNTWQAYNRWPSKYSAQCRLQ